MVINIYASDNYVIIYDGTDTFEYAKGYTTYTLKNDIFTIKETVGGEFKINVSDVNDGNIKNDSNVAYTLATFTTFLRKNTGFKTASGGSDAIVSTGSPVATTTVWVGTQAQYNALTPNSATLYFIQ